MFDILANLVNLKNKNMTFFASLCHDTQNYVQVHPDSTDCLSNISTT